MLIYPGNGKFKIRVFLLVDKFINVQQMILISVEVKVEKEETFQDFISFLL